MGFCLFNNVAVAARHALDRLEAGRVLVLDWDVHHGNGTNDIFYETAEVLYVSIHQSPLYPGTGALTDSGAGAGEGYTVNLPVPPGAGHDEWLGLVQHVVAPIARAYAPDLLLVSAGFDAHRDDPLANCALTEESYAAMAGVMRDALPRAGRAAGLRAGRRLRPGGAGRIGGSNHRGRGWTRATTARSTRARSSPVPVTTTRAGGRSPSRSSHHVVSSGPLRQARVVSIRSAAGGAPQRRRARVRSKTGWGRGMWLEAVSGCRGPRICTRARGQTARIGSDRRPLCPIRNGAYVLSSIVVAMRAISQHGTRGALPITHTRPGLVTNSRTAHHEQRAAREPSLRLLDPLSLTHLLFQAPVPSPPPTPPNVARATPNEVVGCGKKKGAVQARRPCPPLARLPSD